MPKKVVTANPQSSRSAFLTTSYKIISRKQPKTRVSSPRAPLKSSNLNNPNRIRTEKSLHDYPCHSLSLNHGAIYARKATPASYSFFYNSTSHEQRRHWTFISPGLSHFRSRLCAKSTGGRGGTPNYSFLRPSQILRHPCHAFQRAFTFDLSAQRQPQATSIFWRSRARV